MRYLTLSKNFLKQTSHFDVLRLISRHYASHGVMHWDKPITTEIKLEIENYWRDKVHALNHNKPKNEMNKYYVLSMFPYPSGSLHMGHVRVYTLSDIIARYYRMNDKYVIHPIGWDAFGLPAENAAIEREINPAEWTEQNIAQMREQLHDLGCSFDWDREIATSDPNYYKWTQELFLKLYEHNLVYKTYDYVNWDPVDQTVLAEEQVDENGFSWRSGSKVEKKLLNQWFIKTRAFAKSLLDGLEDPILNQWRDIIKIQKNWIGDCNGSNFQFILNSNDPNHPKNVDVWTNHPEFIKDVKFIAISRNSIFNKQTFFNNEENQTVKVPEISFINPFTKEVVPVFLTNEVDFPKGREEYLGIPYASEKDAEFCQSVGIEFDSSKVVSEEERNKLRNEIMLEARKRNLGGFLVSSHLRDWLISRQRFWGTPIPMIHCEKCGDVPVPRDQLPIKLPEIKESSKNIKLISMEEWKNVECPSCGGQASREIDTMDTFVDSSWYYMRYLDPKNKHEMISKEKANQFLPVDLYIGGKEHALLHLYFARFVNHFLHSLGLVPSREPFKQLLVLGMVMGKTYKIKTSGKYITESEIEKVNNKLVEKNTGLPVQCYWDKMSKSKHNGVEPIEMFRKYSLDTIRLLITAGAAPESQRNWSTDNFDLVTNWENKLWLLIRQFLRIRKEFVNGELEINEEDVKRDDIDIIQQRNYHLKNIHKTIIGTGQLSIVISKMMSLTKRLRKVSTSGLATSREFERTFAAQLIMIAPFAPHFASELWAGFCLAPGRLLTDNDQIEWDKEVLEQKWPQLDKDFKMNLNVFVNNHLITTILFKYEDLLRYTKEELLAVAENDEKIKKFLQGWKIVDANVSSPCNLDTDLKLTTQQIEITSHESTG